MTMKKTVALYAAVLILFAITGCSRSVTGGGNGDVPGLSVRERAIEYVTQQLAELREVPPEFYESLGFTEAEFLNLHASNPFTIYLFDDTGQFMEYRAENFVFPLVYQNAIIGIVEVAYLPDSGYESGFAFTVGRSYGDELNSLRDQYKDDDLIIGNLNTRVLFAISGGEVIVFKYNYGDELTGLQVRNILTSIHSSVENPEYFRFPE